jgi:uncharacterized protein (DUF2062 family)
MKSKKGDIELNLMKPSNLNIRSYGWIRWFKLKYFQLIRAKGGSSKVAKGFCIGIAVEMFTLPTGGLAFFLIFPLTWLLRGSVAGALVGFLLGKIIYIPIAILSKIIGQIVIPSSFDLFLGQVLPIWIYKIVGSGLDLIAGGMITGTILGILLYYPVLYMLNLQQIYRKNKRIIRKRKRLKFNVHS